MINASGEFQRIIMNERRNFVYDLEIQFLDGTKKTIDDTMLITSGNSITVSAGTSSLPLGNAVSKILRLTLSNLHEEWSEYNFLGATISVTLSLDLSDGTQERIYLGKFTVVEPESYGTTIGINALDNLYRADKKFDASGISFPASARDVFVEACAQSGLSYVSADFPNNDYMMVAPESDITCRKVLGQCALLAGGNALCDRYGRVFIREYQFSEQDIIDGGIFDSGTPYNTGADLNGGTFAYDDGDDADGGTFADLNKYHIFSNVYTTAIGTDDVVVTKVRATRDEEVYEYGVLDAYVINIASDMYGDLTDACTRIGIILVETSFRPFDISHSCYPLAEMGDYCLITDRKGNTYHSIITDVEFNFRGATQISCKSDSPMRNSSTYLTEETRAIAQTQKLIVQERTERESAIQAMAEEIANANGMYVTDVEQEDKSIIRYMHNKPKLEDSAIQWMFTAETISVSTDFGEHFNMALDASGTAIVKRLVAGSITADKIGGGTYTVGGTGYGVDGKIEVKNTQNNVIVTIDKSGIVLSNGSKIAWAGVDVPAGVVQGTISGSKNTVSQVIEATNLTIKGGGISISNPNEEQNYIDLGYAGRSGHWTRANIHGWHCGYNSLELANYSTARSGYDYSGSIVLKSTSDGTVGFWNAGGFSTIGEKNRIINSKNYGRVKLYCYETPSPMFGDIGEGLLDETGTCDVYIDDTFKECINNQMYQVSLQSYGDGTCYVFDRQSHKFIVKGTPYMRFGWEIKAYQFDAEGKRFDRVEDVENVILPMSLAEEELFRNLYNPESEVF